MFNSYKANVSGAATDTRFVDVGEFDGDSHQLFSDRAGIAVWLPEVEAFFRDHGLLSTWSRRRQARHAA
jgi:hypothetical protein